MNDLMMGVLITIVEVMLMAMMMINTSGTGCYCLHLYLNVLISSVKFVHSNTDVDLLPLI